MVHKLFGLLSQIRKFRNLKCVSTVVYDDYTKSEYHEYIAAALHACRLGQCEQLLNVTCQLQTTNNHEPGSRTTTVGV